MISRSFFLPRVYPFESNQGRRGYKTIQTVPFKCGDPRRDLALKEGAARPPVGLDRFAEIGGIRLQFCTLGSSALWTRPPPSVSQEEPKGSFFFEFFYLKAHPSAPLLYITAFGKQPAGRHEPMYNFEQDAANNMESDEHDVTKYQIPFEGEDDQSIMDMFVGTLEKECNKKSAKVGISNLVDLNV
jgi:hypothetical protein